MTLTWFGWTYLVAAAGSLIYQMYQIEKPRNPLTAGEVTGQLMVTGLIVWGQIAVGMVTR